MTSLHELQTELPTPVDLSRLAEHDWPAMDGWEAYETDAIPTDEFARRFVAEFPLSVTPQEFLRQFESWNRRLIPGIEALLDHLQPRFQLAALSNTNALHWQRLTATSASRACSSALSPCTSWACASRTRVYAHVP